MAARSIASLTLTFGLVSIPVKLYSATESGGTVRFNLLTKDGSRVKQQYVSERDQSVVKRADMIKGYEFEKDRFVLFTAEELKALEESSSHAVEIVSFIPEKSVDPIYYDKAYLLAPDKRGGKPYTLLLAAMRASGRCALANWSWKGKQYVVQVRPAVGDGLILQQLLYADEVRPLSELDIETVAVAPAELQLALQLIDQISTDEYNPKQFEDSEKKRILAAIDAKIAGQEIVTNEPVTTAQGGAEVIDLMAVLRASLAGRGAAKPQTRGAAKTKPVAAADASALPPQATSVLAMPVLAGRERKGAKRAEKPHAAQGARAKK